MGAVAVLAYAAAGVALGTASGLTPGLHANNFAALLAAAAVGLPGSGAAVGAAILAAGVVHTFLDVVPALALGVPDAAFAPGALPGHRLVVAGRGREAVRLSAVGSGLAVALAVPVAAPLSAVVADHRAAVVAGTPLVLAATAVVLVATERTVRAAVGGGVTFLLASGLGLATLPLSLAPVGPLSGGAGGVGGVLTPLFGGLFGVPVLLDALGGSGVPPQDDPDLRLPPATLGGTALAGTAAGGFVGYLPGVSAGVAATLALPVAPGRGPRAFVVASSGANTAVAVFALFALATLGTPRTGVAVGLQAVGAGVESRLLLFVAVAVAAAAAGVVLVVTVGDAYLRVVGRLPHGPLVAGVCGLLVALSLLFAGPVGVAVLVAATVVGLVPPRVGCRRVHLMGVLLGPILVRRTPGWLTAAVGVRLPALPGPFVGIGAW